MKNTINDNIGTLVMPDGSSYSKDGKLTGLNNNIAIIGPSGCGKSSVMGVMNSLNCGGSVLISDPKGGLYRSLSNTLIQMGYNVMKFDLTHPENSMRYNPFAYIKNTNDIQKLAHTLVFGSSGNLHMLSDPYWEQSAETMLCAFIGYLYEINDTEITMVKVLKMLEDLAVYEDIDDRVDKPVYKDFIKLNSDLEAKGKTSWAYSKFHSFITLSEKTLSCIINTAVVLLNNYDNEEMQKLLCGGKFDFTRLGREKTAMFVIVSDTDRSKDAIANLFYSQAMNQLCDYADNYCIGGRLPVSATFILDDFATNCRIENFENIISNIRARNISTIIMLQSLGQLDASYGDGSRTIVNNCDTLIFMGANSTDDAQYFALKANKPLHTMLEMKLYTSWIFRRTEKPRYVKNIIPDNYLRQFNSMLLDNSEDRSISTS